MIAFLGDWVETDKDNYQGLVLMKYSCLSACPDEMKKQLAHKWPHKGSNFKLQNCPQDYPWYTIILVDGQVIIVPELDIIKVRDSKPRDL